MDNYKIPLQLSKVMAGQALDVCEHIEQSLDNSIILIITTRLREQQGNLDFCEIWDLDFELTLKGGILDEKLKQSLLKSVASYEHRLSNVNIVVSIASVRKTQGFGKEADFKNKVNIWLTGIIKETAKEYKFNKSWFLSPLSMEEK